MAGSDYKFCDLCGGKSFYDANLDYTFVHNDPTSPKLKGLGEWSVICEECAKTHTCVVLPRGQTQMKGPSIWMWQNEESGVTGFVDSYQIENGFQQANPRLKLVRPVYFYDAPIPQPVQKPFAYAYRYYDGIRYNGGEKVDGVAPLETIPLYDRPAADKLTRVATVSLSNFRGGENCDFQMERSLSPGTYVLYAALKPDCTLCDDTGDMSTSSSDGFGKCICKLGRAQGQR